MAVMHWFRCDLRLHDNPALAAAARDGAGVVLPVFVLDDALLTSSRMSAARVVFLLQSLRVLDTALRECGSRLVVRHGQPLNVLAELVTSSGVDAVFFNRDYTPFARQRDDAVVAMLRERGVAVHTFQERVLCEPETLLTKNATPYTMYAPYQRRWHERVAETRDEWAPISRVPHLAPVPETVASQPIPEAIDLGHVTTQKMMAGGEAEGRRWLQHFVRASNPNGMASYAKERDLLEPQTTARISPYLHFGCLSPASCIRAAHAAGESDTAEHAGAERWLGELAWRDFYIQILFHFPHVLHSAFKEQLNALEWDNNDAQFAAWCAGQTGYPIVDAAMRQLNSEGWLPNRARLITASFLVKDLLVDWRWGERIFLQRLVDGDLAANNGNWQWIASTGTDAQPFFRMFSPISQSEKADPQGTYIRRYVPELHALPTKYLHAPWTAPASVLQEAGIRFERDYPAPLVDHARQRERTLAMYRRIVNKQRST